MKNLGLIITIIIAFSLAAMVRSLHLGVMWQGIGYLGSAVMGAVIGAAVDYIMEGQ